MKKILAIFAICSCNTMFAQTSDRVDTSNYHSFYVSKPGTTTDFLRSNDVVPILMEELERAGHKWLYDRTIYRLPNGQYFNVTAYSRKSDLGFLYIEGHELFVDKSDRRFLNDKKIPVVHVECIETYGGKADFIRIEKLPDNILVLKEQCYFFQYSTSGKGEGMVTKEMAKEILRQDVRRLLAEAPRPKG